MSLSKSGSNTRNVVMAAVCLALAMVLPFLTAQVPQIAAMISPMHIPVLLAGYVCGPWWALAVGCVAPLLRSVIFGMPALVPNALAMAFELAAYGFFAGLFFGLFPKKTPYIYVSLILAMLIGRAVWGFAMFAILGITGGAFTFEAFMAGAFINAVPAIVIHIVLIPLIVIALRNAKLLYYQ